MALREAEADLAQQLAGLDALEREPNRPDRGARRAWRAVWPKAAAVALVLLAWQAVVWSGWRPAYILPPPGPVLSTLADLLATAVFWEALAITMQRAVTGYALAVLIGGAVGVAVVRVRVLRTAVGSMITGLQTMPS